MPTIAENLTLAIEVLRKAQVPDPAREARSLLMLATKRNMTFLIAHKEYELSDEEQKIFMDFLRRRAKREPIQYIRESQEFYGLEFTVLPGVFIPRPETEMIVEKSVEILKDLPQASFCEIGVGSGCISISILLNTTQTKAVGVDISETALKVARLNTEKYRVDKRLKLIRSNLFENVGSEKFDLIVSNPPYVSKDQLSSLQEEIRNFEPLEALDGGNDGLSIIREILNQAPKFLKPSGWLIMEIGFDQAEKVAALVDKNLWKEIEFFLDLQRIPRIFVARLSQD